MAGTVGHTARTSIRGQAENDSSRRQQIDALLVWPEADDREAPVGQLGAEPHRPERISVDG
jgi:hypothetical protein